MKELRYSRNIPIDDGYDVVVAGGGPSGCAAAITAARLGLKVVIVEALGCLGGMGTSGLVTTMGPLGHINNMLLGGFVRELYDKLRERGYLNGWDTQDRNKDRSYFVWQPFDAEGLKLILDEYMQKENVEVRFFTQVIDVEKDENELNLNGVIVSNVDGIRCIRAKAFIDCTGDAILSGKADVEFLNDDKPMPPTLMALLGGIKWKEMEDYLQYGQPKNQQAIVDKAVEEGYFTFPDRHVPGIFIGAGNMGILNAGHVFDMDPLNNKSLSEGMMLGRKQVQEYVEFFKTHFKGFENIQAACTATLMGVRDSRRIIGEYCLNIEDYKRKAKFHDQVCLNAQDVDLHVRDCSKEEYARFHKEFFETYHYAPHEYYGIPYGVLVPKDSKNLWVAGRAVCVDTKVHASMRMMPVCYALGQAAGTAAVIAVKNGQAACNLDTEKLVISLREQGAILPQETLNKEMTRTPQA